jgi:membrane protease YdiL (CAAX protease family)
VVTAVTAAGAAQLVASLASEPDSPRFYGLTTGVAATWIVGGATVSPVHLGWERGHDGSRHRPVLRPVAVGVGTFAVFYRCALVARRMPVLRRAIAAVLRYAHHGNTTIVLATALINGVAEEVFFRGALYDTVTDRHPVVVSTAVYALVTGVTRNPALVLAAVVMGAVFGWQRQATGGIQAPVLTHLTWSTLMVWLLPPLFYDDTATMRATTVERRPR